ncbi:hypothetical protein VE03_01416 [Pseudogymnoascus sp. 23342-1-I1]|nr:hypothetical protein VE03_01416 [Pseudogymnoascus sp. 23342-1-I1]
MELSKDQISKRKAQNREAQRRFRNRQRKPDSTTLMAYNVDGPQDATTFMAHNNAMDLAPLGRMHSTSLTTSNDDLSKLHASVTEETSMMWDEYFCSEDGRNDVDIPSSGFETNLPLADPLGIAQAQSLTAITPPASKHAANTTATWRPTSSPSPLDIPRNGTVAKAHPQRLGTNTRQEPSLANIHQTVDKRIADLQDVYRGGVILGLFGEDAKLQTCLDALRKRFKLLIEQGELRDEDIAKFQDSYECDGTSRIK